MTIEPAPPPPAPGTTADLPDLPRDPAPAPIAASLPAAKKTALRAGGRTGAGRRLA